MSIEKQMELTQTEFANQNNEIKPDQNFDVISEIRQIIFFVIQRMISDKIQFGMGDSDFISKFKDEMNIEIEATEINQIDLESLVESKLDEIISHNDIGSLKLYFGRVYLESIDKHRVDHIDDMQRLREQVGLMGYAQLDPLVIYKKEAYEKFETLLYNIKSQTLSKILTTDYGTGDMQVEIDTGDDQEIFDRLKSIAGNLKMPENNISYKGPVSITHPKEMFSEDEDGVEVLELDNQNQISSKTEVMDLGKHKLRPNDKVTVLYTNGTYDYDVKYKKVEKSIQKGECKIVG